MERHMGPESQHIHRQQPDTRAPQNQKQSFAIGAELLVQIGELITAQPPQEQQLWRLQHVHHGIHTPRKMLLVKQEASGEKTYPFSHLNESGKVE